MKQKDFSPNMTKEEKFYNVLRAFFVGAKIEGCESGYINLMKIKTRCYEEGVFPETLSNLLGKWIKKITSDYVEFENGEKIDLKNLDYKLIKPLMWW
ncbi:MAG: hypothetical protein NC926_08925 [Candidatus Omnitrophica bacterium]|nr:hypothetical protein [Candidatus Omnitrophota bacterium]